MEENEKIPRQARKHTKGSIAVNVPQNETIQGQLQTRDASRCESTFNGATQPSPVNSRSHNSANLVTNEEHTTDSGPHQPSNRCVPCVSFTLGQVMDHHMAQRRSRKARNTASAAGEHDSHHGISDCHYEGDEKQGYGDQRSKFVAMPSPRPPWVRPLVSSVVTAAWANGEILPLSASVTPYMHLVAPILANELEGRRVAIRTAAGGRCGSEQGYLSWIPIGSDR